MMGSTHTEQPTGPLAQDLTGQAQEGVLQSGASGCYRTLGNKPPRRELSYSMQQFWEDVKCQRKDRVSQA